MVGFFVVHANDSEKFDIKCQLHPDNAKRTIPSEQEMLYIEVESTNNVIKSLHNTKDEIKTKYFNKLLSLAQAGLVGETAQPDLAFKSLNKLKDEIILVEGQRIKNDYMKKLGVNVVVLCCISLLLYLILRCIDENKIILMYFLSFNGALVGTWISFGARKFNITFEQLSLLEEDMMNPWIRLLFIGVCSIIFLLFLNTQIISIGLGEISTTTIKDSYETQLSFGVLCGLVESKIGINLYTKAVNILTD